MWSGELETISYIVLDGVVGNKTASITCTTPLSAIISATVTCALSINTPLELIVTVTSVPFKVVTTWLFDNIDDITLPWTTWCCNILVNKGISFNKADTVPAGNKLKAVSVGANKVNGPAPDNAPSSAHASTATFKVVWSGELDTISYMVLEGFTCIVPTIPGMWGSHW